MFPLLAALVLTVTSCSRGELFRQYEYEEEIYLSLDGSATVYVNTSVAALDALRGAPFDASPNGQISRNDVRAWFTTPVTRVTPAPNTFRRSGRRFVHVRLDVDDIKHLSEAAPFAWSSYRFTRQGDEYVYEQRLGAAAGRDAGHAGWNGREAVAFRLHLPSRITGQNSGTAVRRGNIIVWEQPLADRLRGAPLTLTARMQTRSILYRTLWLFGATFAAVAAAFGLVIWWVMRRPVRGSHHADTV